MIKKLGERITNYTEWAIYSDLNSFSDFYDLLKLLHSSLDGDSIKINISSYGGRVDIGDVLIQAVKESKACVVMEVQTHAHSMAALLALSGDYLLMRPFSYLMFHTYSGMESGKSNEMLESIKNVDWSIKEKWSSILKPFLSKSEIERIHKGEDIYIRAEDESLKIRLKRHFKYGP